MGENGPQGQGAGKAYPVDKIYYTFEDVEYDGVVLNPGEHQISIGYLLAEETDGNLTVAQSSGVLAVSITLRADVTYMASAVDEGNQYSAIIVQMDDHCNSNHFYVIARESCFGKGMVVAASDSLYVGLYKHETGLHRTEIEAIQKKRRAEIWGKLPGADYLFGGSPDQ